MDLSSPMHSLVPSLDSATLEVLAGTESGLSATQIARLASRGTRQGHLIVLDRLVAQGLVLADPANRGSLYRLNRNHVLAESILIAWRARATILERLSRAVETLRPQPLHASVFGSFARGEGGSESDIDLLIVVPDGSQQDDAWSVQMHALGDQVLAWTGNRLESIVITRQHLLQVVAGDEPIVASWLADSVDLVGKPLRELIRLIQKRIDAQ